MQVKAYRKKRLKLNADLADETTLIFALSFTARKAADLSKLICEEKAAGSRFMRFSLAEELEAT